MLLKNIVRGILREGVNYIAEDDDAGAVEVDKKMTEKTLKDEFEVTDTGLEYIKNVLARLTKKAGKLNVAPLELKVLKTRQEKLSDPKLKMERIVNFHAVKLEGKSPIIAGYEFIASIEHSPYGNIINVSPQSSVKELPADYRTASPTCDYCHTKRDRNNTFVFRHTESGEFKRVGSNCLKNFFPDVDPKAILNIASYLGKTLAALVAAESMEDDGGPDGGGGGGSRLRYYDAEEFLKYICLAYFLDGKKYVSGKAVRAAADAGDYNKTSTATFAKTLMNMRWETDAVKRQWTQKIADTMPQAEKLAKEVEDWKDGKDWDAEIEKNPGMAEYFHNMKVISNSPAIQYKNAGYHASLLAGYLREKEWGERKAAEKTQAATKTYLGKIGDKMTFDLKLKKDMTFDGAYGTTYMYIFNDPTGNEVVYFSSRDLGLEQGKDYKIAATVKDHKPSKYNQVPQTIITRGKVVPAPAAPGEEPYVAKDQWGKPLK